MIDFEQSENLTELFDGALIEGYIMYLYRGSHSGGFPGGFEWRVSCVDPKLWPISWIEWGFVGLVYVCYGCYKA